jgi:hypothetical protein
MRHLLPKENPVCVHRWEEEPNRHVFVCTECDYHISMFELYQRQEGDVDTKYTKAIDNRQ